MQTYWVGGTVSGLAGHGLVLQNNAGDDIAMEADGKFRFASAMASGANYAIAVKTQPAGPAQTCSVSKGSGKVVNAAIDDVAVVCSTDSHSVSGSVTGLLGSGLVLTNNTEDLAVTAGGAITFTEPVANGGDYTVTVKTQPSGPAQTCTVSNEHGTGTGSGVNNISVVCTTNSYKVSLALTGLDGVGLVLQNNSGDDIAPTANGNYTFAQEVASGQPYSVTVKTQPTLVTQVCAVSNGSGTIGGANVSDVTVNCTGMAPRFAFLTTIDNGSIGKILPFTIDPVSGALGAMGAQFAASSDAQPNSMAVDAAGTHAYVATRDGINQYNIGNDGALTAMATPKVSAGTQPTSLTLDPKGRFAYALNISIAHGKLSLLPIGADGSLGTVKQVAVQRPIGFALEASGRFVYVAHTINNITAFKVDDAGTLTSVAKLTASKEVLSLATDAAGRFLYAVVDAPHTGYAVYVYTIGATGELTEAGSVSISGSQSPTGVVPHPSGRFAYVTLADGSIRTFAIDATTGALSVTGGDTAALNTPILRAAPDATGRFLVVSTMDGALAYAIDHATGALGAPSVTSVSGTTSVAL